MKLPTPFFVVSVATFAAAALVASSASAQQAVQWRVEDGGNGHWYQVRRTATRTNFDFKVNEARNVGAELASIADSFENDAVLSIALGSGLSMGRLCIGGRRCGSCLWNWVDGTPWNFTNWGLGEPGNPGDVHAEMFITFSVPGAWADVWDFDGSERSFAIEWSADCNGDGIVDYGQCRDGTLPDYNGNNIPDCCERGEVCVVGNYPVQWRVEDGGNGHWYAMTESAGTWDQMQLLAQQSGGQLASIASSAENNFVRSLMPPTGGCWIGARKLPDLPWEWADGSNWSFTNWCPGEPCCFDNGKYVFVAGSGCWDDHNQTETLRRGVIEWSADCNNDGIVDYGQILQGTLADSNGNGVPDECDQPQQEGGFIRFTRPTDTVRIFGNTEFPGVDFTYEMRIRVDAESPLGAVIHEQRDTYEAKLLSLSGSNFWGYFTRGQHCGNVNESTGLDIAGAWHHIAWTRSDSVARLFVDGQLVSAWPSQIVCTGNSPDSLMSLGMMRYAWGCVEFESFRGDLDWLRVSRTCRYTQPFTPPAEFDAVSDADTLLRLTFNEALGTVQLVDSGPNQYQCERGAVGCGGPATAPNLVRFEPTCADADLSRDFDVNSNDLGSLLGQWGPATLLTTADFNGDGMVGGEDLGFLLLNWGSCPN